MLIEIRNLLEERRRMTLRDLALHFRTEPSVLEPMLDRLVERGRICRIEEAGGPLCGRCSGCSRRDKAVQVIYALPEEVSDPEGNEA